MSIDTFKSVNYKIKNLLKVLFQITTNFNEFKFKSLSDTLEFL